MSLQFENSNLKRMDMSGLSLLEKLRWALNERLCERMRLLNSSFFDEVDDFLFTGGQHGQFIQDSVCLNSMREIRAKQDLFEETFLSTVSAQLQNIGADESSAGSRQQGEFTNDDEDAVYERVEIDLALKTMQRKAFKFYLPFIKRLENLSQQKNAEYDLGFLQKELLIEHTLQAFSSAQEVFNLTLEARLILLKLFERHFLMKMEKLFLDTISVINNSSDEAFIEKLYSSSSSFKSRQTNLDSDSVQDHRIDVARNAIMKSEEIEERISALIEEFRQVAGLPKYVIAMIDKRWRAIMFVIGLNNGVDGKEFIQATDSIRNLIGLVMNPKLDTISPARIKEQLKKGFHLVQCPQEEQQLFFEQLEQGLSNRDGRGGDKVQQSDANVTTTSTPRNSATEAAVSPFAATVLDSDDLNELSDLLDSDDHTVNESLSPGDETMTYHLTLVDELQDGAEAKYSTFNEVQSCRIYRSSKVDNNYEIKDPQGRVILTRSRLGLAVSLREGELQQLDCPNDMAQKTVSPHIPIDAVEPELRQITLVDPVIRPPEA